MPQSAAPVLEQAALVSPIFATRWRWDSTRALALPRFRNGKKVPIQIQRMRADDLLAAVFPDAAACQDNIEGDIRIPDHPLIREVMKDVLTEALDLEGLKRVLRGIGDGSIRCLAVDTPAPSQFSHEILNANPYAYLDDAPIEERRARAVSLRRVMPETVLTDIGRLDPAAIAQVREEAWPDVRDADELNEVLQVFVALPENFVPPVAQALLPVPEVFSEGRMHSQEWLCYRWPRSGAISLVNSSPINAPLVPGWAAASSGLQPKRSRPSRGSSPRRSSRP